MKIFTFFTSILGSIAGTTQTLAETVEAGASVAKDSINHEGVMQIQQRVADFKELKEELEITEEDEVSYLTALDLMAERKNPKKKSKKTEEETK